MQVAFLRRRLPALLIAVPVLATAQGRPPTKPDPLDATAPVPRVVFDSSLRSLPRHAEVTIGDWRAANETVARIGGWRSYLREAQAPAAPPAARPASAPAERRP